MNTAADDSHFHSLLIVEEEEEMDNRDVEEEQKEIEDDVVLAIDIAQTPLSPTDASLSLSSSSLFVNTSRVNHHSSSPYMTKSLPLPPSLPLSLSLCAIASSPIRSSSTLSTVSLSCSSSTDVEAVSTTSEAAKEKHSYLPLSIITERDIEEVEKEVEGGHLLQGPFLTRKELSPLSIYLAVTPEKVSSRVFNCLYLWVCACVWMWVLRRAGKFFYLCLCRTE